MSTNEQVTHFLDSYQVYLSYMELMETDLIFLFGHIIKIRTTIVPSAYEIFLSENDRVVTNHLWSFWQVSKA